jgi:release factor glutamine methyltransferase
MTILETIRKGSEYLTARGVESPRLQVELLLAHVLKLPRLKLYLQFDRELSAAETDVLRDLVKRRGQREPLQHLTGSVSFLGMELRVTRDVLIPRPETETLAQLARDRLASLATTAKTEGRTLKCLDFGTGSGCLILTLAGMGSDCGVEFHALDRSAAALAVARSNATAQTGLAPVQFHEGDGFQALPEGLCFDLVVSNPPYIPSAEVETLDPEVRDHDPRMALDGGDDGLSFYRRLAVEGVRWQPAGGWMLLELGDGQAPAVGELFASNGWLIESVEKDLSDRERVLIVRRPGTAPD